MRGRADRFKALLKSSVCASVMVLAIAPAFAAESHDAEAGKAALLFASDIGGASPASSPPTFSGADLSHFEQQVPSYTWDEVVDGVSKAFATLLGQTNPSDERKRQLCPKCKIEQPTFAPLPGRKPLPPTLVTDKPQPPAPVDEIEYVLVDGRAHPTVGSASPFEFPQQGGNDESGRQQFIRRAVSANKRDKIWNAWVAQVAALKSDPVAMLRKSDEIADRTLHYVDYEGYDWRAPSKARDEGGVCREYALFKFALLKDAGFPVADLRVMTVTPKAPERMVYHVVMAARTRDADGMVREWILDMVDKADSVVRHGIVIPRAEYQPGRGMVWSGNTEGFANLPVTIANMDDAVRALAPARAETLREANGEENGTANVPPAEAYRRQAPSGSVRAVIRAHDDFPRYRIAR